MPQHKFRTGDVVSVALKPIEYPLDRMWARVLQPSQPPGFYLVQSNTGQLYRVWEDNIRIINQPAASRG